MRRPQIRRDSSPLGPRTAVCLGAFDGLHRGHEALFDRARRHGDHVALVTFEPHPQRVLAPDRPLHLLLDPAQRGRTAAALGVDTMVLLPFDATVAQTSAQDFVEHQLVPLAPVAVVVGADFRFGHGRRGDAAMLTAMLGARGIAVDVVEPVPVDGRFAESKIGSSAIRDAIMRGDVAGARAMLGRPHAVVGTVVRGEQRGRTIGIPTANFDTGDALMPKAGVYAVWLWPLGAPGGLVGPVAGVANLGTNPTFAGTRGVRLEVHVIDRDLGESLYGATAEVWFVERLRDEQRFDGVDALVARIRADIDLARARLVDPEGDGVLPAPTDDHDRSAGASP